MDILHEKVIRRLIDVYGFVTTQELAQMLDISVSSIKHHLPQIKKELEGFDVVLESVPRKGLYLTADLTKRQSILEALDKFANQEPESFAYRKSYILDILFKYKPNYTIQLFSEELYVSRNTIQKDLTHIEDTLKKHHLRLVKKRNSGITIEGNEFFIRQAIVEDSNSRYLSQEYITELPRELDCRISKKAYTYTVNAYKGEGFSLLSLQKELLLAEENLNFIFTDISFGRMLEYLAITIKRIRRGNIIKEKTRENLLKVEQEWMDQASLILEHLLGAVDEPLALEVQYLAARMYMSSFYDVRQLQPHEPYLTIAIDFLQKISLVVGGESLAANKILIHNLSVFLEKTVFRDNYQMHVWSDLHQDIQDRSPSLYAMCMTYLYDIEKKLQISFKQDDIAWIVLLIHNAIKDSKYFVKAVFVSAADKLTAKYQINKLEDAIAGLKVLKNLHYSKFDPEKVHDKLVISTVRNQAGIENVIEVTKHLSGKDIKKIIQHIEQHNEFPKQQKKDHVIESVFQQDLMLGDISVVDKVDVIKKASDLLYEKGYITEGFENQIWEREAIRPTYIGNGIAIPHVYEDCVKKSGVVVVRLKHPVLWSEEKKAKIIFVMAINFKTREEIGEFFRFLYEFIENKEWKKVFLEASEDKMFDVLKRFGNHDSKPDLLV